MSTQPNMLRVKAALQRYSQPKAFTVSPDVQVLEEPDRSVVYSISLKSGGGQGVRANLPPVDERVSQFKSNALHWQTIIYDTINLCLDLELNAAMTPAAAYRAIHARLAVLPKDRKKDIPDHINDAIEDLRKVIFAGEETDKEIVKKVKKKAQPKAPSSRINPITITRDPSNRDGPDFVAEDEAEASLRDAAAARSDVYAFSPRIFIFKVGNNVERLQELLCGSPKWIHYQQTHQVKVTLTKKGGMIELECEDFSNWTVEEIRAIFADFDNPLPGAVIFPKED